MVKVILHDHWVTKELGLQVFIHPEDAINWVYVKTDNGLIHRFYPIFIDDKETSKPYIEDLNKKTYNGLLGLHKHLAGKIHDLIKVYYVTSNIELEDIEELQNILKDSRKYF